MVIYGWYVKGGDVMGICMGGVKTGMAELGVSMRMAGGGEGFAPAEPHRKLS